MSEKHDDHEWHGSPTKRYQVALGICAFLVAYALALAASYGLTGLLYQRAGMPTEFVRNVITGVVGLLLLFGLSQLTRLFGRKHKREYENIHNTLTEALAQIARGDFNITLNSHIYDQHGYLVDAINDMAENLGNLETMRQDFVSNVSHEIQSPLTSIGGFATLLQDEGLPAEDRVRYAKIIEDESKRLSSLSDNLLKLSTLDNHPLNQQGFRLDRQMEHVALTLEPQWMEKGIRLEADLQKLEIRGDEALLSQVWMNLLHNAIKFTPEGGRIVLSLEEDGESAVVKITDTGEGIAPEDQVHIFERFFKVDKARDRSLGGNGLGLSLVKKIVELHQGSIAVDSKIGMGTTFQIILPHLHSV